MVIESIDCLVGWLVGLSVSVSLDGPFGGDIVLVSGGKRVDDFSEVCR
jgi:hypothetical protein